MRSTMRLPFRRAIRRSISETKAQTIFSWYLKQYSSEHSNDPPLRSQTNGPILGSQMISNKLRRSSVGISN